VIICSGKGDTNSLKNRSYAYMIFFIEDDSFNIIDSSVYKKPIIIKNDSNEKTETNLLVRSA
jgi:hypothetical protein